MQADDIAAIIENNMLQHGLVANDDLFAVVPLLHGHVYDGHGATGPLVLIGFLAGQPVYRTTHTVAHHMEGNWSGAFNIHWPPLFPNIWLPECELMQLDVTIQREDEPNPPPAEHVDSSDEDDSENDDDSSHDGDFNDDDDDSYDEGIDTGDDEHDGDDHHSAGEHDNDRFDNADDFDEAGDADDNNYDDDEYDDYEDYNDNDDDDHDFDDFEYIEDKQEYEATIGCLDQLDIKWINFHHFHKN